MWNISHDDNEITLGCYLKLSNPVNGQNKLLADYRK